MRRVTLCRLAWLGALTLLAAALPARALMAPPPPIAQRVAMADTVVLGKVTAIEEKTVQATPFPGAEEKAEYQIAVVKIDEALVGAKGLTSVKVGFLVPKPRRPGAPISSADLRGTPKLAVGQEALLFLYPHHDAGFHTVPGFYEILDKKTKTFARDVEQARKAAKLLADPMPGLKSKDATERLETASMLIARYRVQRVPEAKSEPIDAEESRLILQALVDADWKKPVKFTEASPLMAFGMLNLQPADGWNPGEFRNPNDYPDAAQKWLKENAKTFRIQRFVNEKKDK
jgi:hypothetical protein